MDLARGYLAQIPLLRRVYQLAASMERGNFIMDRVVYVGPLYYSRIRVTSNCKSP